MGDMSPVLRRRTEATTEGRDDGINFLAQSSAAGSLEGDVIDTTSDLRLAIGLSLDLRRDDCDGSNYWAATVLKTEPVDDRARINSNDFSNVISFTSSVKTRKRKPSATVTSASLAEDIQPEILANTIQTELFDIPSATINIEPSDKGDVVECASTLNDEPIPEHSSMTNSKFAHLLENSTMISYSKVGTNTNSNGIRNLSFPAVNLGINTKEQSDMEFMVHPGIAASATTATVVTTTSTEDDGLEVPVNQTKVESTDSVTNIPQELPESGPSTKVAEVVTNVNSNQTDFQLLTHWVPFPDMPVGNAFSPFTPFQVEQLNHQLRMYRLFNLMTPANVRAKISLKRTAAEKRAKKPTPSSASVTLNDVDKIIETRLARLRKDTTILPVVADSIHVKISRRGRGRPKQSVTLAASVVPPIPVALQTPTFKNKRAAAVGHSTVYDDFLQTLRYSEPVQKKKKKRSDAVVVPDIPVELVDCTFCATSVPLFDSLSIESCQHAFCRECLRNFIENNKEPQIPCPIKEEMLCNGFLSDPEIKDIVSDEVFQEYLSRSMLTALEADSQLAHCFEPECSGICLIEDGLRSFYCPVCARLNCINCKSIHDRPCKRNKQRSNEDGDIGLGDSDQEDDDEDDGLIAMKFPVAETETEATMRKEWEASWEQLCLKFNAGKEDQVEDDNEEMKTKIEKSLWSESISHMEGFTDLITTDQVFECPICFVDAEIGEGVILQECFHRFCRDCLAATVEHSEEPQVKCPFQCGNYSCQMLIMDREVKSLVSQEVYDKLLKKSLSTAEMSMSNAFHCQSVNCTGWVEVESQVATFKCFICDKENCVPCKAIHETISCAEYQSRLREGECDVASKKALNKLIDKGEAMRCPTCKVVIMKNGGCDGMTCVVCRTSICWATKGPRWGAKGQGDMSGGCRCGVDGKKCHPNCGNCH